MSAFARAAALFQRVVVLPAEERQAALAGEEDAEVRTLVAEMLAGESDPHTALEAGLPGLGRLVGSALDDEDDEARLDLAEGPYSVHGVLARGGMGVVLRGRDEEIGRNVAIKVLRGHPGDGARLRFIEEAQVAGQLEHPGIVPIYHLGTDDSGRPFFAMKLVEGETLAARLERRGDPREERARFLGLFLQVCQTVAYAHARRVIHRDLKPANVMVGTFGEVQVLDWGLAKVLGSPEPDRPSTRDGRSEGGHGPQPDSALETVRTRSGSSSASLSGTVMGTPRYIPPEQAQGEVERLDERADVFSLGAILCEILTGAPPFTGEREEALEAARSGRVGPALERLATSGADPALIALARRSLAVLPADRPADARELAAEVERSLTAVQERAHAAELEAEAARARLQSERRARRLTVAFTLAAAVFAVCLVALFQWRAHERERDVLKLSSEVAAALDRAGERFEDARAAPLDETGPWDAAGLALDAAESILAGRETTDAVRTRLQRLRTDFTAARSTRDAAAAVRARDRALKARLEEIRMPTGDGLDPYDYPRMQASYRAAFEEYGVYVEDETGAGARLAESAIARELGQALDQWALGHRVLATQETEERVEISNRLLRLAAAADPDPLRTRVRDALRELDVEALRSLADAAREDPSFAPETILLIAGGLRVSGDDRRAVELLRSAVFHERGDFWLSLQAAIALRATSDGGSEEALAYFQGALGARPGSREARHLLGQNLNALGRAEEALAEYEELIRIAPDYGHAYAHAASLVQELRGWTEALPLAEDAARLAPDDAYALSWYGSTLESTGSPWRALAPLERAVELERTPYHLGRLASALAAAGRSVEALARNEEAIALGSEELAAFYNGGTLASELGDLERAEELLRRCIELYPEFPQAHCNLGAVLRYQGRFDEAREAYLRCNALARGTRGWTYPAEEWAAEMERASILADELDVYVGGEFDPTTGSDALFLAEVAQDVGWTAAASDFYQRILDAGGDLSLTNRDDAAHAAARASAGDGEDARELSEDERTAQAELALHGLEALRSRLMENFRADPPGEVQGTYSWLEEWTVDPVFQPLRDPPASWDAELRTEAASFWSRVREDLAEIASRFDE